VDSGFNETVSDQRPRPPSLRRQTFPQPPPAVSMTGSNLNRWRDCQPAAVALRWGTGTEVAAMLDRQGAQEDRVAGYAASF